MHNYKSIYYKKSHEQTAADFTYNEIRDGRDNEVYFMTVLLYRRVS